MLARILDFAPALAFFITYRMTSNLIMATGVIIAGCVLSSIIQYLLWRKISRMQVFLTAAVVLFGLPTILLNDPEIIKWKVTVVNFILALAILICQHIIHKNPIGYILGKELPLPEHIWLKLGTAFMLFFIFAGCLNIVIAFYLPELLGIDAKYAESLWVDYKTFGSTILNVVFSIALMSYMMYRYPEMRNFFKDEKAEAVSENKNLNAPEFESEQHKD